MMPAGMGHPGGPPDDAAMMAGMDAFLGGPQGGLPPGSATEVPGNEGGEADVIAALALENVQLRALVGLGPDDPVPMPEGAGPAAAPPMGGPGPEAAPPGGGLPPGLF